VLAGPAPDFELVKNLLRSTRRYRSLAAVTP
jgi:hypothetical protein